MLAWVLYNTVVAVVLALVVTLVCRLNSARPALCHLLWVVVLAVLVAPPLPVNNLPGAALRDGMGAWLGVPEAPPADAMAGPVSGSVAPLSLPAELELGSWPVVQGSRPLSPPTSSFWSLARLAELSLTIWLLLLWAAGSAVLLVRHAMRILAFDRRVAQAEPAPGALEIAVGSVAERLAIAPPPVRLLTGVGSPSVWCLGRPRLLWPASQAAEGAGDPALVAHELAHIARRDHWVARAIALAEVLLWWHPLLWLVRRRVHDYSELSCDAWALWAYPADRRAYAEALIDAQERTITAPLALQGLCATGRSERDFRRRLTMIMSRHVSPRVSKTAAALAIVATLLVLPGFSDETGSKRAANSPANSSTAGWMAGIERTVDVHRLSQKGEQLFKQKHLEEAAAVFSQVVELDPENGPAHARLGYMAIGAGQYDKALQHLSQQLAAGHLPGVAAYNQACAYTLVGSLDKAQKALIHAVHLGFRDGELLASDTDLIAMRETGGYLAAKKAVARADAIKSKLSGFSSWLTNDEEELALRRELGDITTLDGEFQSKLGVDLLSAGHAEAAAVAFQRQADGGHAPATANYNLACAHAVSGSTEGAHTALAAAAELGMNYAPILDDKDFASVRDQPWFGKLASRIADGGNARMKLKQALTTGDTDAVAALVSDMSYSGEAQAGSHAWASLALGTLLLDQGRTDEAVGHLHTAAGHGSYLEDVSFQLSRAQATLGNHKSALRHLDDALTLGFADGEAVAQLLKAHAMGSEETRHDLLLRAESSAKKEDWAKQEKLKRKKKQADYSGSEAN